MDWSRAKTVFIIMFLILDIFLFYQFMNQKSENNFDIIQETPIDQQLKADNIQIKTELPDKPLKESYIKADEMHFKKQQLIDLSNQTITIINDTTLKSKLTRPYKLKNDWKAADIDHFVSTYTFNGDKYKFAEYDRSKNIITYYQVYKNHVLFKNKSGRIQLFLNDQNEIVSYTQTMLGGIEEVSKQEIITAYDAMIILYNKGLLDGGSSITNVEFGYYTLVPIKTSQLLAPTWRFTIDRKYDFFVNAVEGHVLNAEEEHLSS